MFRILCGPQFAARTAHLLLFGKLKFSTLHILRLQLEPHRELNWHPKHSTDLLKNKLRGIKLDTR